MAASICSASDPNEWLDFCEFDLTTKHRARSKIKIVLFINIVFITVGMVVTIKTIFLVNKNWT